MTIPRPDSGKLPYPAWPVLEALGGSPVYPTTDSGYKSYGAGRLFLPAATNYCTNPSFETDSNSDGKSDIWDFTGIVNTASAPTFTRPSGRLGGYAQRMQYTGAAGDSNTYAQPFFSTEGVSGSPAAGDIVTFSAYVKGSLSGASLHLRLRARAGGSNNGDFDGTAITLTGDWQRVSVTSTALAGGTTYVYGMFRCYGIDNGDTIDITIDDVLIEKSSVLTPYLDGSYPGCAWTETAHASTSVRTVSALTITGGLPAGLTAAGTIAAQFATLYAGNDSVAHQMWGIGCVTSGWIQVTKGSANVLNARLNDGANRTTGNVSVSWAAGALNSNVTRWTSSATLDNNINGTDNTQAVVAAAPIGTPTFYSDIDVYLSSGSASKFMYLGPVIISPTRWSDADTTSFQANRASLWPDPVALYNWLKGHGYAGSLLLPLDGDSVGYLVR